SWSPTSPASQMHPGPPPPPTASPDTPRSMRQPNPPPPFAPTPDRSSTDYDPPGPEPNHAPPERNSAADRPQRHRRPVEAATRATPGTAHLPPHHPPAGPVEEPTRTASSAPRHHSADPSTTQVHPSTNPTPAPPMAPAPYLPTPA